MTPLRRALSGLSAALIAVLGVMFLSTAVMACDGRPSLNSPAAMDMSSDPGTCPDAPDVDCQKGCRVFCHGLVAAPPEPSRPTSFIPFRYWTIATERESFRHDAEDPPPRG
ncbi:hypothetical protein [Brevundimonas variabilis]|uniref:Uncharacterized protein n=1 Tax=Brevundimonas variabilis TaxID=74312 RepID=A0A7W9CHP8_9CAUL|nr:hypothetical protein [Brevundimonas variabilis]MBB5745686.1 hypothetical protein [Brevundimonas variabilis]